MAYLGCLNNPHVQLQSRTGLNLKISWPNDQCLLTCWREAMKKLRKAQCWPDRTPLLHRGGKVCYYFISLLDWIRLHNSSWFKLMTLLSLSSITGITDICHFPRHKCSSLLTHSSQKVHNLFLNDEAISYMLFVGQRYKGEEAPRCMFTVLDSYQQKTWCGSGDQMHRIPSSCVKHVSLGISGAFPRRYLSQSSSS